MSIKSQRARLFEAARALAAVPADDFFGSVEIHIHKGSVGTVKIVQSLKAADLEERRMT